MSDVGFQARSSRQLLNSAPADRQNGPDTPPPPPPRWRNSHMEGKAEEGGVKAQMEVTL